jgi:hypothetical protein
MKGHQGVSTSKKTLIIVETFGQLKAEVSDYLTAHVFTEALRYTTMSNGKLRPNGLNYAGKLARLHITTKGYELDPKKRLKALKVIEKRGLRFLTMVPQGLMTPISLRDNLTTGANVVFVDSEDGPNERENFPLVEYCVDAVAHGWLRGVFVYAFREATVFDLLRRYRQKLVGSMLLRKAMHQGTLFMVCRKDDAEVRGVLEAETLDRCGHMVGFVGRPKV